MRVDSLSGYEPNYKIGKLRFQKDPFISVAADKIKELKLPHVSKWHWDEAQGIKYNFIVFQMHPMDIHLTPIC